MPKDFSGRPSGEAFVEVSSEDAAEYNYNFDSVPLCLFPVVWKDGVVGFIYCNSLFA